MRTLILLFLFAWPVYSKENIAFKLESKKDGVMAYLINISDESLMVNGRYAVARKSDVFSDISFEIEDTSGKVFGFLRKVRIFKPDKEDMINLRANKFIGKWFSCKYFAYYYGLPSGEYKVRGLHMNPYGNKAISMETGEYIVPGGGELIEIESNETVLTISDSCSSEKLSELPIPY